MGWYLFVWVLGIACGMILCGRLITGKWFNFGG